MARRFFYLSLGILCLALAYNLGARSARADWDQTGSACVAGSHSNYYWSQSGECWQLDFGAWVRESSMDLPVPATDVAITGYGGGNGVIVTRTGDTWVQDGTTWTQVSVFPGCSGTAVQKDSWGGVKQRFRD